MEIESITDTIVEICKRLNKSQKYLFNLAKTKSEAERIYRIELSQELIRLRAEGTTVAILSDIARGNVAESRYIRDLTDAQYKSSLETIDSLKSQLSALQSILKYKSEN